MEKRRNNMKLPNNIKKYFQNKPKEPEKPIVSENKCISINSGTAMTTNTSTKKLKNFNSIGSLNNAKDGRDKLLNSKSAEPDQNLLHKNYLKSSESPKSDMINLGSSRKLNADYCDTHPVNIVNQNGISNFENRVNQTDLNQVSTFGKL